MNPTVSTSPSAPGSVSISDEIDASCRVPLFVMFSRAAFWLIVASVFGLIASIKFHSPNFLADSAWLTYGRVYAVAKNALLYGFAIQSGLGVALWIVARLSANRAAQPWLIGLGAKFWNLGVLVGVIGVFLGDSTGFENIEMPRYAAVLLFLGYLIVGYWSVVTLHYRSERALEPSQWFLLAALFWFPWIFSTAHLLLTVYPVRGVTQAVIQWWFSANLTMVWFGLIGLGALFYFIPRCTNRPLHSRYLALFTFWTLILFASWTGIPNSAPVPAWMPAISTVASVLTVITVISLALNVYQTVRGCDCKAKNPPAGKFLKFGLLAFVAAWLLNALASLPQVSSVTQFTWFSVALSHLNVYGFFAMTMFGAIYYIVPLVFGIEWPLAKAVKAHYWAAATGLILLVVPLAAGGVLQGFKWNNPEIDAVNVARSTLHFLRLSTAGEMLLLVGHLLFLANVLGVARRYCRTHFAPLYSDAVAEVKPAEVKP